MTGSRDPAVLVGRSAELELLERRLHDAGAGRGGVVLIGGEAGIGKTALANRLAEVAADTGFEVGWGRCREDRGSPPLWPWVQAMAALGLTDAGLIGEAAGPAATDIASVLDPTSGHTTDDDHEAAVASRRFRLFEGLRDVIAWGGRPRCVLIDDLHRADDETTRFLDHLVGAIDRLPVLVVAALRDGEVADESTLKEVLGELATSPACDHIHLGELDAGAAGELVRTISRELDGDAARRVIDRSGGHPFFLEQLVRAGGREDAELPPTIREAVSRRIDRLPDETIDALGAAAVVGREFTVEDVAHLIGGDRTAAAAQLDPAIDERLVDDDGPGLRFRHVILRDVLYAELSRARRRDAHRRLSERELGSTSTADELVEVAHHAMAAVELGGDAEIVRLARRAGLAAASRFGPGEAAHWLEIALEHAGDGDPVTALSLESGEAHLRAGRADVARERFESAAERAKQEGDVDSMTRAALAVGRCVVTAGSVDWALVDLLEDSRRTLPDGHPAEARVVARHGIELYWLDGERARELTAEALELLEPSSDPRIRAEVLFARLFCLRGPGRLEERLRIGDELVDLAVRAQLRDAEFRGRAWLIPELLQVPDLPAYDATIVALAELADRSGEPLHRWYADLFRAQAAIARGDHDVGRELAESARLAGLRSQAPVAAVYHIGHEYLIRRDVGGLEDIVDDLAELSARFPAFTTLRALLGLVYAELGERDRAAAEIVRLANQRFAAVPEDSLWIATLGMCAEVTVRVELDSTGRLLASLLRPHSGTCAVQGLPTCFGAVDRYIGLALAAAGDADEARRFLDRALDQHRQWGFVPFAMRTQVERALVEVASGELGPADRERLIGELSPTRDEARERGYARLVGEIDEAIGAVRRSEVRHPSGPGGTLTDREAEVLALIADGAANKDVARELHISVNTVERHARNIFNKLGVANRVEATAAHLRHLSPQDHGSP